MSHMTPDIESGSWYEVEANHGETHIIPRDVSGDVETSGELADYVDGTIDDPDAAPVLKTGWLARLSAPGYLDCTDWITAETELEAIEALLDMHGTQDEPRYWESWEYDLHRRILELKGQGRFAVVLHPDRCAVLDRITEESADACVFVDAIEAMADDQSPTSEEFRAAWESDLNVDEEETLQAYFPDQHKIEHGEE